MKMPKVALLVGIKVVFPFLLMRVNYGIETVVWIESNEKDADYEWYTNTRSSDEAEKTCFALGQSAEILSGTFYVNSVSGSSNGIREGGEAFLINLDPMSKRALQLRNY